MSARARAEKLARLRRQRRARNLGELGEPSDRSMHARPQPAGRGLTRRPWWPWARGLAGGLFFALIALLLVNEARHIDWGAVWLAAVRLPLPALLGAAALAALSLAVYSCFDLLGRHYTGHRLPVRTVMAVTFISYVFNLNLGSLVGALGLRYRLYTRLGLDYGRITRVISVSMLANWLGYVLLAGSVLLLWPPALPPSWPLGSTGLRLLGAALLAASAAYLLRCAVGRRRQFTLRGHVLALPSARLAAAQAVLGLTNWLLMSGIVFMLLRQQVGFTMVVSTLLLASVAGVITHVPAGLGVLEAVFLSLLSPALARHEVLAALVLYRLIYYLTPLLGAALLYLQLELRAGRAKPARAVTPQALGTGPD